MILKTIDKFAGFKISGSLVAVCGIGQVSATLSLKSVHRTDFTFAVRSRLRLGTVAFESAYLLCTVQMKKAVGILRYLPSFSMVEISGFEPLTS